MYIGPDSLALVQHLHAHFGDFMNSKIDRHGVFRILDLCCGSGVQALATLGMLDLLRESGHESANEVVNIEAVAVDINQRALRFTEFNTRLNGFGFCSKMDGSTMCDQEMKVTIVRSDLLADDTTPFMEKMVGKSVSDYLETGVNRKFDILLANPPFIPVPNMVTDHTTLSLRESKPIAYNSQSYGLFSVGGVGGEDCLLAVIQMSPHLLRRDGGLMGIVSEFMNPPLNYVDKQKCLLLTKIEKWFGTHDVAARGVLFTNEHPLTRQVYAKRRALTDDKDTISLWLRHLENHHINHVSPGLLFVKSQSDGNEPNTGCQLEYSLVPKSRLGSVWTPQNVNAVEHTMKVLNKLFHSPPQLDNYP
jgi:methylase of polypeptide subunit release factors